MKTKRGNIYLIFLFLLIIAYAIFLAVTYWNCSKTVPEACEINECKFSVSGFKLVTDLEDDCCGNKVCEIGETYPECTADCPDCDDTNECTTDSFDYPKHECINEPIIPCCGNGICDEETAETYLSCSKDCPDCDDDNKLTADSFNYATQECENIVTHYSIDDFDEDSASWDLEEDPRFVIVDSMLAKDELADYAYTSFGDQTWTDYRLSLKVKREQGFVEINVRSSGEKGNYAFSIFEDTLILAKDVKPRIDFETKEYSFASDKFYNIKIEVKGNNIKVYVDEELQIDYTDTDNPIPAGGVGLYISDKSYIDDIEVEII